jgi:hypothetical protein
MSLEGSRTDTYDSRVEQKDESRVGQNSSRNDAISKNLLKFTETMDKL